MSDVDKVTLLTKRDDTIDGIKRMADEMDWMLDFIKDNENYIMMTLRRENERWRITLTIEPQPAEVEV